MISIYIILKVKAIMKKILLTVFSIILCLSEMNNAHGFVRYEDDNTRKRKIDLERLCMFDLLARLFVRDYKNVKDPTVRRAYGMLVSIVGITLNFILAAGKLVVGMLSGSLAIEADAVNNLSDAGASLVALICFRISAKPADRHHPYGHARIEYVASMIVSFLILLVGLEIGRAHV